MTEYKNIDFTVLTLNLQMYEGKFTSSSLIRVIYDHNPDLIIFRGDVQYMFKSDSQYDHSNLHDDLNNNHYIFIGRCGNELYTESQRTMMNSMYIHLKHASSTIRNIRHDNMCTYINYGTTGIIENDPVHGSAILSNFKIYDKDMTFVVSRIYPARPNIVNNVFSRIEGIKPTIFIADFDSGITKTFNDDAMGSLELNHQALINNKMIPAEPSKVTNAYKKMNNIYYDKEKLILMDVKAVNTLDFTDHNALVAKFKLNYMAEYHKTPKSFLYYRTINSIRQFKSDLIKYTDNFANEYMDAEDIYNHMFHNIMDTPLKTILDSVFDTFTVPKGTRLYSSETVRDLQLNNFGSDRTEIIQKIYEAHNKLRNKQESVFWDVYRRHTSERNQGAIYTTSCFNKNNDTNNPVLSLSPRYYGENVDSTSYMIIFETNQTFSIYNLHPENFRSRNLFRSMLTNILLGGKFNYNISYDDLEKMTSSAHSAHAVPLFWDYQNDCKKLLECTDPNKECMIGTKCLEHQPCETTIERLSVKKECIKSYLDGDNTLHENIVNHFIHVYNMYNWNKQIIGYTARDMSNDPLLGVDIPAREMVWFNQESMLKPLGIYYKGYIIRHLYDYYRVLLKYIIDNKQSIGIKKKKELSLELLKKIADKICSTSVTETNDFISGVSLNIDWDNFVKMINEPLKAHQIQLDSENDNRMISQHGGDPYYDKYKKYKDKYKELKRKR